VDVSNAIPIDDLVTEKELHTHNTESISTHAQIGSLNSQRQAVVKRVVTMTLDRGLLLKGLSSFRH
jgi:hypothetical protein